MTPTQQRTASKLIAQFVDFAETIDMPLLLVALDTEHDTSSRVVFSDPQHLADLGQTTMCALSSSGAQLILLEKPLTSNFN